MLKVIIVDDEMLVRIGIKSTICWEDYGFTVIAEASSGEEALQKIRELRPDVLLTDIRMPKMDGIELLKQIEAEQIPIESIIMSCYNEFELVRSAMKYGASDYLLKLSFKEEELLAVLERVRKKILARRGQTALSPQTDSHALREQLARLLLEGGASPEQMDRLAAGLNFCVHFSNMAVLILSADPAFSASGLQYEPLDTQTQQLILNMVHDQLSGHLCGNILPLQEPRDHFLVLLNPGLDLLQMANNITGRLRKYLNLPFSVGILDYSCCEADGLRQLPQQLTAFASLRYIKGPGGIHSLGGPPSQYPPRQQRLKASRWLSDIHGIADFPKIPEIIRAVSAQMCSQHLSRDACQQIFTEMFYHLSAFFQTYGGNINGLNEMCGFPLANRLSSLQFLSDAEEWFRVYAVLAERYWQECCSQWKRSDILSAVHYIQNNYQKPISANTAAKEVGISSAYFSTLFKQETGLSFTEYLTEFRMEKARQLLEDKSIYIYEIGDRVGYPDPNYFCKVFKRCTGMSPAAYRKKSKP